MTQAKGSMDGDQISVVIFEIGREQFAIDINDVQEIIPAGIIRRLPKSLEYIDGIYNYRGEIIHIINLYKKLKINECLLYRAKVEATEENKDGHKKFLIILNVNNMKVGFSADKIMNITHVNVKDIEVLNSVLKNSIAIEYINGIIKFEDRPRILLNLSKILTDDEYLSVQQENST